LNDDRYQRGKQIRETILGEATEMAVKSTTTKLVAAKSRLE